MVVVLVPLIASDAEHLPMCLWAPVHLPGRSVCSGPLPILKSDGLFVVRLYEFLYILAISPLPGIGCEYLLPVSGLPFCFVAAFFCCAEAF